VLTRKFDFRATTAASIRAELEALGEVVEPASIARVTRSAADDLVLAAVVAGKVEVIVTGDKELLAIATYQGNRIESPRTFLESWRTAPNWAPSASPPDA
jgi:predicted nucleic acid-binding protein